MRIIVISDTHIPKRKNLPGHLMEKMEKADLIIHAGDWQTLDVYTMLSGLNTVEGVYGNVDSGELWSLLPKKKVLELNGFQIGIVHGDGVGKTTEKRAIEAFHGEQLDCLIFGHSHIPVHKYIDSTLLFNPGSPTDKRRQKQFSYGVIELGQSLKASIVHYT